MGILFPDCNENEVKAHSAISVSHPSARGNKTVTFDYMMDNYPRFQGVNNRDYWTSKARVKCYPILGVDASKLHKMCLRVAFAKPYNYTAFRINPLCGGVLPFDTWFSNTSIIGPSTCVALTMRVVAASLSRDDTPLTNDAAAFASLGIQQEGFCATRVLTGYTPDAAVGALLSAGALGESVGGFTEATNSASYDTDLPRPILLLRI